MVKRSVIIDNIKQNVAPGVWKIISSISHFYISNCRICLLISI